MNTSHLNRVKNKRDPMISQKKLTAQKRYYLKNHEKILNCVKQYYWDHKEEIKKRKAIWYQQDKLKNPEKYKKRNNEKWEKIKNDPVRYDRYKRTRKKWSDRNRKKLNKQAKIHYYKNREKILQKAHEHYKEKEKNHER